MARLSIQQRSFPRNSLRCPPILPLTYDPVRPTRIVGFNACSRRVRRVAHEDMFHTEKPVMKASSASAANQRDLHRYAVKSPIKPAKSRSFDIAPTKEAGALGPCLYRYLLIAL